MGLERVCEKNEALQDKTLFWILVRHE